jgi:Ca2+-binding RTX toxin-like protein
MTLSDQMIANAYGVAPLGTVGLLYSALATNYVLGRNTEQGDSLTGTPSADFIHAGKGDDTIFSASNTYNVADIIDGGAGNDAISYISYYNAITAYIAIDTGSGASFTGSIVKSSEIESSTYNYLFNIEKIIGTAYGDAFHVSRGGEVTLDGGDGVDTVSYEGASEGVAASIGAEWSVPGANTLLNIEKVVGSAHDDAFNFTGLEFDIVLDGGAGDDILHGGTGNDMLIGGSGHNIIDGGADEDWLDYSQESGVYISVYGAADGYMGYTSKGLYSSDQFSGIEHIIGSDDVEHFNLTSGSYFGISGHTPPRTMGALLLAV